MGRELPELLTRIAPLNFGVAASQQSAADCIRNLAALC